MATQFTDEQLSALVNAGFSAEEITLFQFDPTYAPTESELNSLTATKNIKEAIDSLPSDINALIKKIESTYGILIKQNLPKKDLEEKVALLEQKDPELAKQAAILFTLVDYASEED